MNALAYVIGPLVLVVVVAPICALAVLAYEFIRAPHGLEE